MVNFCLHPDPDHYLTRQVTVITGRVIEIATCRGCGYESMTMPYRIQRQWRAPRTARN